MPNTICIIYATTHAITHCATTTKQAHLPPSSRLTDEIAATHGV